MSTKPQTREERKREAWQRIGVGSAIAGTGGAISQTAARRLITDPNPPKGPLRYAPHALRLATSKVPGSKRQAVANLMGRGAQLSGVGLAASGSANLQRKRMKTNDPVRVKDAVKEATVASVPGGKQVAAKLKGHKTDDRSNLEAKVLHGTALTGSTLGALGGSQALANKLPPKYRVAGRALGGTTGAIGTAALLTPLTNRLVRERTKGKSKVTDDGKLITKSVTGQERKDREKIINDKRTQAAMSLTGGALGLGSTGMLVAPKVAEKVSQAHLKAGRVPPKRLVAFARKKLPYAAVTTTGAGLGGLSALNFARLQSREAKQEKRELAKYDLAATMWPVEKGLGRILKRPARTAKARLTMRRGSVQRASSGKMSYRRGSVG